MNHENLELWLHDLETTNERQTRGALTRAGERTGDCCLGRLCKVAIANGCEVGVVTSFNGEYVVYDGESAMPPQSVRNWLGTQDGTRLYSTSADMNDASRLSFKEIAERIRKDFA